MNRRFLFTSFTLILGFIPVRDIHALVCEELLMGMSGIAAAAKFGEEIAKMPVAKFDPRLCKGINACSTELTTIDPETSIKDSFELNKKYYEDYYSKQLPPTIEGYKKEISQVSELIKKLEATIPKDEKTIASHKTLLEGFEKELKKMSDQYSSYQAHLKDPKKFPHPMVNDGVAMTLEEHRAKVMKQNATEFEDIPSKIKEWQDSIALQKNDLRDLKQQKEKDASTIKMYENDIKISEKKINILTSLQAKYQEYKKNSGSAGDFLLLGLDSQLRLAEIPEGCDATKDVFENVAADLTNLKAGTRGLSADEMVALRFYMGSGYQCMNAFARNNQKNPNIAFLNETLNKGLSKIPSYRGFVNRGAYLTESLRAEHKVGSIVDYAAFTSTATFNGFSSTDMFKIFSKTGKPVMSFAGGGGEYEVLFKTHTKFKVLEVTEKEGRHYYVMKEVTEAEAKLADAEDKKYLADLAQAKAEGKASDGIKSQPDEWKCPINDKLKLPPFINQKQLPPFN